MVFQFLLLEHCIFLCLLLSWSVAMKFLKVETAPCPFLKSIPSNTTPFIPKALNMFGNWINDEHFSLALKILFLYSANERKMLNWLSQGQLRGSKHLAQIRIIRNLSTPSHFFPLKHISLKWRAAVTSALICIQPRLRYQGHWQPETHFCHLQLVFTGNSESL